MSAAVQLARELAVMRPEARAAVQYRALAQELMDHAGVKESEDYWQIIAYNRRLTAGDRAVYICGKVYETPLESMYR